MNDIQLYSAIMFLAGVLVTKAVFYFDQKRKTERFYLVMSAAILQVLDAVYTSHMAAVEFAQTELEKTKTLEETEIEEYLEKESNKVSIFMELYTLILIRAVPEKGRRYINYRSWTEASSLIEQLRGLTKDGKDKG